MNSRYWTKLGNKQQKWRNSKPLHNSTHISNEIKKNFFLTFLEWVCNNFDDLNWLHFVVYSAQFQSSSGPLIFLKTLLLLFTQINSFTKFQFNCIVCCSIYRRCIARFVFSHTESLSSASSSSSQNIYRKQKIQSVKCCRIQKVADLHNRQTFQQSGGIDVKNIWLMVRVSRKMFTWFVCGQPRTRSRASRAYIAMSNACDHFEQCWLWFLFWLYRTVNEHASI